MFLKYIGKEDTRVRSFGRKIDIAVGETFECSEDEWKMYTEQSYRKSFEKVEKVEKVKEEPKKAVEKEQKIEEPTKTPETNDLKIEEVGGNLTPVDDEENDEEDEKNEPVKTEKVKPKKKAKSKKKSKK